VAAGQLPAEAALRRAPFPAPTARQALQRTQANLVR
jgi:hypothetical protein